MRIAVIHALLGAMLVGQPVLAQSLTGLLSNGKSAAPPVSTPTDPLGRTSPRSSIYSFLEACHRNNFVLASAYMDLRNVKPQERSKAAPELAKELGELLDRDPQFEVDQLSNRPEGSGGGLQSSLEELATLRLKNKTVALQMERVTQQGIAVWLVSADSVARIPELSALTGESAIEKRLPEVLVATKLMDTPIWVWLALVLVALILSLVSRLLSRMFLALVKPFTNRYAKSLRTYRLEAFTEPLRVLVSLAVFRACMELIPPSALLRDYLLKGITLLFVLGIALLLMRVVDIVSDQVISRLNPAERALSYSVVPLIVRFVKICVFCAAVLFTLSAWGYNTNAILAGVSIGGLALALAAQKTIENLFGGISVISDRPVLVGDFCQFGGQVGTIEDIGLRSTRIRTLERTLVTVPNSQFSTMTLENYSRRDRMWFHPTLHLRRDTTPEQIGEMMDAVTRILQEHSMIDATGVPLRFTKINPESFSLEVFAYVLTSDYNEYLKVQSELLLKILQAAAELEVGFAVPVQESISAAAGEKRGAGADEGGRPVVVGGDGER